MSIVKKEVSLNEIKQMLSEGKTRKEIAAHYELPLSALSKSVFQHPDLKNKKSKKVYEIALIEDSVQESQSDISSFNMGRVVDMPEEPEVQEQQTEEVVAEEVSVSDDAWN
jgi:hypothetical protein